MESALQVRSQVKRPSPWCSETLKIGWSQFSARGSAKRQFKGAEYRALIKGLEIALEHGIDKIRAYVDNQLVVDQINDLARVNSDRLKPLHSKANDLLAEFADQRVYWVPRERNVVADALVREALYPS